MPFGEAKRAFLVRVLGEERVARLEEDLPRAEKMLEEMGIAFKDDGAIVGRPLGGAVSFAQADAYTKASQAAQETLDLVDVFHIITSNVLTDDELKAADKPALLKAAATEFGARLSGLGKKELEELTPRMVKVGEGQKAGDFGGAKYVADLLAGSGVKSLNDEAAQEVEALRGPAAGIVRDLLRQGAIQQG
jgi:hypothetical protein